MKRFTHFTLLAVLLVTPGKGQTDSTTDSGTSITTNVVGSTGGSTTTPDAGGSTTTSDAGGSTTTPDAGGSTTTPDAGSSTTTPDAGGSNTTPDAGGSTTTPDAGGSTTTPDAGSSTTTPDAGSSNTTPDAGGSTTTPDAGGSTTTPDAGSSNTTPDAGGSTTTPDAGGSTTTPDAGDSTTTPDAGDSTTTPDAGGSTTTPDAGGSTTTPDAGGSTTTPDAGGSTTTPDAGGSTTTPDAGGSTTTPDAGGSTTTPDAGGSTTTPDAGGSTTTTDAVGSTTTTDVGGFTTTTDARGSTTTIDAGGSTTTTDARGSTTTGKHYPCQSSNCRTDSTCVNLNDTFFCLCRESYYYKQQKCNEGKIYPGTLTFKISYTPVLENKESLSYQKLHLEITQFFERIFNASDYGQTVIHKVSPSVSTRYSMHVSGSIDITLVNILNKATKLTEDDVSRKITAAVEKEYPKTASFKGKTLCDYYGCEEDNSSNCSDSFKCVCKFGMYRPNPQASHCVPDPCPGNCSSKPNMHCQWDPNLTHANCVCLPDYMKDENSNCQRCAFGYSGENCQDQFQLILTIVGTVAGICILAMVIKLIITRVSSSSNKREDERHALVENDFQNMALQQTEFSKACTNGRLFPKACITPSNQLQNSYNSYSRNTRDIPYPDY